MTTTEKIRNYEGKNGFIISLQGGLKKYGRLTERQIEVADKFFVNNEETKKSFIPKDVNIDIKVKRYIATKIAEENNTDFKPFLMTISKVLDETKYAYKVVGRMTTSDVTCCRNCGRDLTDWRSQATGVGSTCAKHMGIEYVRKQEDIEVFLKMLQIMVDRVGDLTFWLPKSQIKEGYKELQESIG
jgi:hypothetical protein